MEHEYRLHFWVLLLVALLCTYKMQYTTIREGLARLRWRSLSFDQGDGKVEDTAALSLSFKYLVVYLFVVASDWLQGPYIYALYSEYGYERDLISYLFVTGYASSMFLGTFVGSLADRMGRKLLSLAYCFLYSLCCLTKHSKVFSWLLLGRVLGGAATSLLKSVFESWLVCEHNKRKPGSSGLSHILALAALVNSVAAILCGLLGDKVANIMPKSKVWYLDDWFRGSYTLVFDCAILCCFVAALLITALWDENYGTVDKQTEQGFSAGLKVVINSKVILIIGLAQACFEGAMYCFVFMWTPALLAESKEGEKPPFGIIFSSFMVCCMLGSQLFELMLVKDISITGVLSGVFAISAVALSVSLIFGRDFQYFGFLIFETCVGLYFPAMGTLKGETIPDSNRATVYNIYRVPLNAFVILILTANFSQQSTFLLCSLLNIVGLACVRGIKWSVSTSVPNPGLSRELHALSTHSLGSGC